MKRKKIQCHPQENFFFERPLRGNENSKNATWHWQWAHLAICTCDMHNWTRYMWYVLQLDRHTGPLLTAFNTCRDMNYYPVWFFYTDRRTDRQKATQRSPPCRLHRWAQKHEMKWKGAKREIPFGTNVYVWARIGADFFFNSLEVKLCHKEAIQTINNRDKKSVWPTFWRILMLISGPVDHSYMQLNY